MRLLLALLALWSLAGCAGTWSSSDPIYPSDWPALAPINEPQGVPDLFGTYRAVSDPAGPLAYPEGGAPREMFMFVPYGGPEPTPRLGRRVLPWHLAGVFRRPSDRDRWDQLERFASALRPDGAHPDGQEDLGWVRLSDAGAGGINIECGVGERALASVVLRPTPERSALGSMWSYAGGYTIRNGDLVVVGGFPLSPVECAHPGADRMAGGTFTFRRAADGSLVMLESLHATPPGGSLVFRKWWRWRRID